MSRSFVAIVAAILVAVVAAGVLAAWPSRRGGSPTTTQAAAPEPRAVTKAGPATDSVAEEQPAPAAPVSPGQGPDPRVVEVTVDRVITDLNQVTDMAVAHDGSGRLFFVEKRGVIRIWQNGAWLSDAYLDIQDRVATTNGTNDEMGLLGLAFDPDYATNGLFYVNYTADTPRRRTVVSRFHVGADANHADAASEHEVLTFNQPFANHNGGDLNFGPEGYLYVAIGDGGSGGDPMGNGQNTDEILGSLARINVDPDASSIIPDDNPYAGQTRKAQEIWSWGLRNPWRFSFDPANWDLYIADVGQNTWEEVDYAAAPNAGRNVNYGWNIMEGTHCFGNGGCNRNGKELPVAEHSHDSGFCSITGGFVYRGAATPGAQGLYLYSDWCAREIWGLSRDARGDWRSAEVGNAGFGVSSFGVDEAGEIWIMGTNNAGRIVFSRVPEPPTPGTVTATPSEPVPTDTPTATEPAPTNTATSTAPPPTPTASGLLLPLSLDRARTP